MNEHGGKLYIPQNGQDYAVACANGQSEIPVNFKTAKDGTYTLSIENENLELGYLYLIDNLTGNEVDLLATPSYTFEAKTSNYASRFRLLFAPISEDADGDNETFAYVSHDEIIVHNPDQATLQIVDLMGRVIMEEDATNRVSTTKIAPGLYILRLINGEKVDMQKIVIE